LPKNNDVETPPTPVKEAHAGIQELRRGDGLEYRNFEVIPSI
jgi:hypothetical protein